MSDYSNTYGGAAKDSANSIILAADIDTQLDAVEVAVATKAESPATGTSVATTSGTTASFTDIPSWATQITMTLVGVSGTNAGSVLEVQLGDSGGLETTGYVTKTVGAVTSAGTISSYSTNTGFIKITGTSVATTPENGSLVMTLVDSATNTWHLQGNVIGSSIAFSQGNKALTTTLTQVQLEISAGTFDAGIVNIRYS